MLEHRRLPGLVACGLTRCPRTRADLDWRLNPDRLDVLTDCLHPVYQLGMEAGRVNPAWV